MAFSWETARTRFDTFDMARVIRQIPAQFSFALTDANFPGVKPVAQPSRVIVTGMGGSAMPADLVAGIPETGLARPLEVFRDYVIEGPVTERTVCIGMSFSGNTEETIAALRQAHGAGAQCYIVCCGGEMESLAKTWQRPCVRVTKDREPQGFQPRSATGYMFTYLWRLLHGLGLAADPAGPITKLVKTLEAADTRGTAYDLALMLDRSIPVFYAEAKYVPSVARIIKIKLNENAKMPAFYNTIPESNHNETIGQTGTTGQFAHVLIDDPQMNPINRLRFEIMEQAFAARGLRHVRFHKIPMQGDTVLERTFTALGFGEWLSHGLALLRGIDPTPVDLVEDFKKLLKEARAARGI